MSAIKNTLALMAVLVVVPFVARDRGAPPPAPAISAKTTEPQATAPDVRAFLQGVRGANAMQCELILQAFNGWSSGIVPDRDSAAYAVSRVMHSRIGDAQAVTEMESALRGDDLCAARTAARLLGRSGLPESRATLLAALADSNTRVRQLAAVGLGFSSDTTTTPRLVRALADGDAGVRAAAAWALGAVR
ncbi:MAG TPA: HEAT repeat domain-containing protein [Gemmatimonadaceae bacterium]